MAGLGDATTLLARFVPCFQRQLPAHSPPRNMEAKYCQVSPRFLGQRSQPGERSEAQVGLALPIPSHRSGR